MKKEAVELEDSMEDDNFTSNTTEDDKKKKGGGSAAAKKGSSGGTSSMRCCQAEKCMVDLYDAKTYHQRHRVCEQHAKAAVAIVARNRQRLSAMQQVHEVSEFDEAKRSCRRRLAGHNERKRKNSADSHSSEGGSSSTGGQICGQVDDRGRIQIAVQENASNYKHFHVG